MFWQRILVKLREFFFHELCHQDKGLESQGLQNMEG